MKSLLFLLVFLPLFNEQVALDGITKAIGTGNVSALEPYLDNAVEIAILDQEQVYAKAQAVTVLKSFFAKNKPQSFNQMHQGQSKGKEAIYSICTLSTAGGSYRVYIYVKVEGDKQMVQEIRFDKE